MLREGVQHLQRSISRSVVNAVGRVRLPQAADFIDEDWDVLILLDACRADYYREATPFDGDVQTRVVPGSASHEFIEATFLDRELHDTVYVTPNPHLYMLDGDVFHAVRDCRDAWDERLQTVTPEAMTDICRSVAAEYPDKRLILHYMQPHTPYLGATADRIRERFAFAGWNPDHVSDGNPESRDRPLIWDLVRDGEIEWSDVRSAYRETLERAIESVAELVADLDGRVVVSADHGELLGERLVPGGPREWAHPEGLSARQLRVVPWQVVQDESRPEITAEPPEERSELSEEAVNDRLRALGYVDEASD